MAKRAKFVKPASRRIVSAQVVANKRISPSFIRVTIAGEELSTIAPMGADQWFRMFIPQVGQSELRLPSAASNLWYAQYLLMSKDTRPVVRNYTIRAYRAAGSGLFGETTEIDIDFAYHGDIGPATMSPSSTKAASTTPHPRPSGNCSSATRAHFRRSSAFWKPRRQTCVPRSSSRFRTSKTSKTFRSWRTSTCIGSFARTNTQRRVF